MATDPSIEQKIQTLQNNEALLDPDKDIVDNFKPTKRERDIRRRVYERWYLLRDAPARLDAERDWEIADKEYAMTTVIPDDPNDWRANLQLPDAFAAIQSQAQETIERKARPHLTKTEDSDEPVEDFANSVMTYNMNNTGFDAQAALSKLAASIRGTSFRWDYWRTEKRVVKDPTGVDADGNITYQDKEIVDFDDDYTEWVPNEFTYVDEKAKHIDDAIDCFRREIINIEEFHRVYGNKPGFKNTEWVRAGGDTGTRSYFKLPVDVTSQDVEVLHYYNRAVDAYWSVANNIPILDSPLPTKHKELPLAVDYQYRLPGQFWGIGIPKVIHMLSEERKTIRNLNLDRQKIIISGAFLHNNAFDLDDEDTVLEPGRMIGVDTNGQPLSAAVQQVQMSETGPSYFKSEEILLEDIRRATGIDDRIQGVNVGGTATEAAILKESSLKRINLISFTNEMDSVVRLGRLKWSNIQFFYGTPRLERITEDNEEREEKVYRQISVKDKKFSIVDDNGKKSLKMEDAKGNSALTLDKKMAKYLEGSFDISVDADIFTPVSKAIEQTKKTEMFSLGLSNPATLAVMDIPGAFADVLTVNNIDPKKWMKNVTSKHDMMMLAESENMVMAAGQPLDGTPDATEDHTLVHLMYTKTAEFQQLPPEIQQIIMDHILQEHDNNPATGSSADALGAFGLGGQPGAAPGAPNALSVGAGQTTQPQAQVADLQPTNFANPE